MGAYCSASPLPPSSPGEGPPLFPDTFTVVATWELLPVYTTLTTVTDQEVIALSKTCQPQQTPHSYSRGSGVGGCPRHVTGTLRKGQGAHMSKSLAPGNPTFCGVALCLFKLYLCHRQAEESCVSQKWVFKVTDSTMWHRPS